MRPRSRSAALSRGEPVAWPLQVTLPGEQSAHDVLAKVWARKKIEELMQQTYYMGSPAVEEEVTAMAPGLPADEPVHEFRGGGRKGCRPDREPSGRPSHLGGCLCPFRCRRARNGKASSDLRARLRAMCSNWQAKSPALGLKDARLFAGKARGGRGAGMGGMGGMGFGMGGFGRRSGPPGDARGRRRSSGDAANASCAVVCQRPSSKRGKRRSRALRGGPAR